MTEITTNSVRKKCQWQHQELRQEINPQDIQNTCGHICLPGSSSANSWQGVILPLEYRQSDTPKRLQIGPPIPPVASYHAPWCPCFCPLPQSSLMGSFRENNVSSVPAGRETRTKRWVHLCAGVCGYSLCGVSFFPLNWLLPFSFFSFLSEWHH